VNGFPERRAGPLVGRQQVLGEVENLTVESGPSSTSELGDSKIKVSVPPSPS
jgi:hypothetical protein